MSYSVSAGFRRSLLTKSLKALLEERTVLTFFSGPVPLSANHPISEECLPLLTIRYNVPLSFIVKGGYLVNTTPEVDPYRKDWSGYAKRSGAATFFRIFNGVNNELSVANGGEDWEIAPNRTNGNNTNRIQGTVGLENATLLMDQTILSGRKYLIDTFAIGYPI